jgi:zinc transport system substrate-binding protein
MIRKISLIAILSALLAGCSGTKTTNTEPTIYVSITPLKMLVEEITCGDFPVEVLVPEGASPETYDPTARQLTEANDAQMLFTTGLITFEQHLAERIANPERVINLSEGIELLSGTCSHSHCGHKHGIDPHIWTSPRALKQIVRNIDASLPADSSKYHTNADKLLDKLNNLDSLCSKSIELNSIDAIMIYHPAFTYYAHDYGIEQIAIEHDGKEPSPRQLTSLIDIARSHNITKLLIQPQYNKEKLQSLASECNAEIVEVDPLSEDIIAEIERVTRIICSK